MNDARTPMGDVKKETVAGLLEQWALDIDRDGTPSQAGPSVDELRQLAASLRQPDTRMEGGGEQCCVCGKTGLSTVEGDGGQECQLSDGRWTCSQDCYYTAADWFSRVAAPSSPTVGELEVVAWHRAGSDDFQKKTPHSTDISNGVYVPLADHASAQSSIQRAEREIASLTEKLASEKSAFRIMVENNKMANAQWDAAEAQLAEARKVLSKAMDFRDSDYVPNTLFDRIAAFLASLGEKQDAE